MRNKSNKVESKLKTESANDTLFDIESNIAEQDDDYALIEHQLEKQRQIEAQKKEKSKTLKGADFVAQLLKQRD